MNGSIFVHADGSGFHVAADLPTGIPISEIRAIRYSGPGVINAEWVPDLKKWFEDRIEEGYNFDLPESSNGTE